MAGLNFNAATVDPQTSFEPIPAGWYNAIIEESEMKPTKNGDGSYLELKLKVMDGQYQNRVVFDRLNLNNKNEQAVEIAYQTLSAICHAVNVIQVQDSQQLHNIPLQVKVSIRAADGQYDAANEVKGYKAYEGPAAQTGMPMGSAPTMTPPAQPMVAPQQPSQGVAPPAQQVDTSQQAPAFQPPVQPAQQPPTFQAPAQAQQPVQQPVQQEAAQPQQPVQPANPELTAPQTPPGAAEAPPWAQPQG